MTIGMRAPLVLFTNMLFMVSELYIAVLVVNYGIFNTIVLEIP